MLQLQVFAGNSTNAKKVAEFGGNTHGFGSRSVLGSGWPKDPLKVHSHPTTAFTHLLVHLVQYQVLIANVFFAG